GHCAQLLLGALCDGDAARFSALRLRFASPVFPGDTLRLLVWHDGPGRAVFEGLVQDRTVVSSASFSHR
ncbi:MAG: 3-alpha,7-alpha,12-alpha-trihydroxy-5-beta-cholest-24-enoyl-CoA hydratase, partial [Burkholderiales bacterium]|nr:3-alpha,7-alpha,12-alpha-trihydroxy-5-beta-cholest-24-enoyl-CoA hydratase [Burkholderiales bacterium]